LKLIIGIVVTTSGWLLVTFLTRPTDTSTLERFCALVKPGGPGWRKITGYQAATGRTWDVPTGILAMLLGCLAVYTALFAVGNLIYGELFLGATLGGVSLVASVVLLKLLKNIKFE
jgi:hypothetical protein